LFYYFNKVALQLKKLQGPLKIYAVNKVESLSVNVMSLQVVVQ